MKNNISLQSMLTWSTAFLLFLLPWQTILITREVIMNGGKWQYGTVGWYGTELLLWFVVMLFVAWYGKNLLAHRREKKDAWRFTSDRQFVLACLGFLGYCFFSIAWASDAAIALQHALRILEAVLLFFVLLLGPLRMSHLLIAVVSGSVVQSVFGIVQFLFQRTWSSVWLGLTEYHAMTSGVSVVAGDEIGRWLRAYGSFPHPNMLGGYLVITLIATSLLWYRYREKEKRWMPIVWLAAVVQLVALFLTFSRAAWIAILVYAVGLFVYRWHEAGEKKNLIKITVLFVSIVLLLGTLFFPLIKNRTTHESALEVRSTTERVSGYEEAWQLFLSKPLIGVGVGNYTAAVIAQDASRPGWEYQPVHLVPLLLLVEVGVLGMALLILLIMSFHTTFCVRAKNQRILFGLVLVPLVVLAVLDHFLASSAVGLWLLGVFFACSARLGRSI